MQEKRSWIYWIALGAGCLAIGTACTAYLKSAAKRNAKPSDVLGIGATLQGKRPFPADNAWNQDISSLPVDPMSEVFVAGIGLNKPLHPDFGPKYGIPYIVISAEQAKHKMTIEIENAAESDAGPYPIPPNAPIEGGADAPADADRHVIVVDRDNWKLYELFAVFAEGEGANRRWRAGSGAIFNLATNAMRPAGWTSADAAGLPIFPGLVRYDETVERKEINHAIRFTCRHTRRAYIAPARHFASRSNDESLPPMGMRVRLKASVDISGYPPTAQVVLKALKKYGMILADNGSDWFISGSPDARWDNDEVNSLKKIHGSNFEVVRMGEMVTK